MDIPQQTELKEKVIENFGDIWECAECGGSGTIVGHRPIGEDERGVHYINSMEQCDACAAEGRSSASDIWDFVYLEVEAAEERVRQDLVANGLNHLTSAERLQVYASLLGMEMDRACRETNGSEMVYELKGSHGNVKVEFNQLDQVN